MKQGERPSDKVKEEIYRLAAKEPRPTNTAIQAAVKERFSTSVSPRAISRYCKKAGLPTSSLSTKELEQSPACRSIRVDPLLVTLRQQHQDDICSLAAAESEELSVPVCHDTPFRKRNWVVDCKGRWTLPAEQHELYPFLRDHLKADDLWQELDDLRAKLPEYQQQCKDLLVDIEKLATNKIYARCPVAPSSDRVLPCITPWFSSLIYYESVSMAMGIADPIREPYKLEPMGEDVVGLKIHASYIAYALDVRGLELLKLAHHRLRKKWKGHPRPKQLVVQYQELAETKNSINRRLEPNLVRQLVYRGNCERCP